MPYDPVEAANFAKLVTAARHLVISSPHKRVTTTDFHEKMVNYGLLRDDATAFANLLNSAQLRETLTRHIELIPQKK